jgi:hypothetical protein
MLQGLAVGLALLAGTTNGRALPRPAPSLIDGIAALVDGVPIFRSELLARVRPYLAQGGRTEAQEARLPAEVLEQMFDETLIEIDAARLGLGVTEAELAAAIVMLKQINGLDAARLEAAVQGSGMTLAEYEDQLRYQLLEQRWLMVRAADIDAFLFAEDASLTDAFGTARQRLVAELRERSFIEVRW